MKRSKMYYGLSLLLVAAGAAGFASAEAPPTKGGIPKGAFEENGDVQWELVPEYIPADDRNGQHAGWIHKSEVSEGKVHTQRVPVLDETLSRPVGFMVPGRGFVPIGVPDESVPKFDVHAVWESTDGTKGEASSDN